MRIGSALQLTLAAFCFVPFCTRADDTSAAFLGSFEWSMPQPWFGGLSGLELSADGSDLTAITDRGRVISGRIDRAGGRITGLTVMDSHHLRRQNGQALIGKTVDSEGLAIGKDGSLFISFEHIHRVARYDDPAGPAQGLRRISELRALPPNAGIEALAIDAAGRLYAMPEKAFDDTGRIPVLRWSDGRWSRPFALPSDRRFLPVGADFGPDGRLYLLERNFNPFGFRSRLRSWRIGETGAEDERVILLTDRGTHDNLEAVSVWADADGRIRVTMVSDDNFLFLQRSEIVEYALTEGLAQDAASR